jgi:hypothetical protein
MIIMMMMIMLIMMIMLMMMVMIMIMTMLIMLGCGSVESMNRYGTDLVAEGRGSVSECFLNIVRALGMGFCVVELNNKNEMSISSLFMLLI